MAMTNKQLRELLESYPDESIVSIFEHNNYGGNEEDIVSVTIDFFDNDCYKVPHITLKS